MLVPDPKTWIDNEVVTPEMLNLELRDALAFLLNPPSAQLSASVVQNMTSGSSVVLAYDTVEHDTDSMADVAANRLVIQTPGLYEVAAYLRIKVTGTGAGRLQVKILINGTDSPLGGLLEEDYFSGTGNPIPSVYLEARIPLEAGDIVTANGLHTSSVSEDTFVSNGRPRLAVRWVGTGA